MLVELIPGMGTMCSVLTILTAILIDNGSVTVARHQINKEEMSKVMFNGCRGLSYSGFGSNGFGGIIMMIIPLLLIGIVVYAVFKLLNQQRYNESKDNSNAINILSEKYALGEISEEEYLKKKKLLGR